MHKYTQMKYCNCDSFRAVLSCEYVWRSEVSNIMDFTLSGPQLQVEGHILDLLL